MTIEFTAKFLRSFRKIVLRRREVAVSVLQKVLLFSQQPHSPSLSLHKLKGELKDVWSFSIENDLRIIVDLKDPDKALFVNIGNHNEVY